jgi:hypothetical protein
MSKYLVYGFATFDPCINWWTFELFLHTGYKKNAAVNIHVQVLYVCMASFFLCIYLGVELLGYRVNMFSFLWDNHSVFQPDYTVFFRRLLFRFLTHFLKKLTLLWFPTWPLLIPVGGMAFLLLGIGESLYWASCDTIPKGKNWASLMLGGIEIQAFQVVSIVTLWQG